MSGKNAQPTPPFAALGGAMSDSFELMRKAWGLAGLPTLPGARPMAQFAAGLPSALPQMITPTLDVEEMDKRIADLKAVEQWLNLNMNMLRTTIQTLEVQRNTVATLKTYGGSMLQTMMGSIPGAHGNPDRNEIPASATAPGAKRAAPAAAAPAPVSAPSRARPSKLSSASAPLSDMALPLNPTAWWGSLQEQFAKIAGAASASAATATNERKPATSRKSTRRRVRDRSAPE